MFQHRTAVQIYLMLFFFPNKQVLLISAPIVAIFLYGSALTFCNNHARDWIFCKSITLSFILIQLHRKQIKCREIICKNIRDCFIAMKKHYDQGKSCNGTLLMWGLIRVREGSSVIILKGYIPTGRHGAESYIRIPRQVPRRKHLPFTWAFETSRPTCSATP